MLLQLSCQALFFKNIPSLWDKSFPLILGCFNFLFRPLHTWKLCFWTQTFGYYSILSQIDSDLGSKCCPQGCRVEQSSGPVLVCYVYCKKKYTTNLVTLNNRKWFSPSSRSQKYELCITVPKPKYLQGSSLSSAESISCLLKFLVIVSFLGLWSHQSTLCLHGHIASSLPAKYSSALLL